MTQAIAQPYLGGDLSPVQVSLRAAEGSKILPFKKVTASSPSA